MKMTSAETIALMRSRKRRQGRLRSTWKHALLITTSLFMIYPLLWMLGSAFKPEHLIFSDLSLWPSQWKWTNFAQGWNGLSVSFTTFYLNSFLVAGLSVAGNLMACSLAAFAF